MGEIADDLIEGACCSLCGVYFEDEHGYSVLCEDCFDSDDQDMYPKATEDEV